MPQLQIDEGNVYMNRFDYETEPESDTFEGHKDFLDIHIVAEGREFLGYADASGLKVVKEYDKDGDFLLYKGRAELRIMLEPGRVCHMLSGGCAYAQNPHRDIGKGEKSSS